MLDGQGWAQAGVRAHIPLLRFMADSPVFVLLLTAAVYLRCTRNEFVFDDKEMIVRNRFLGDWAMVWDSFVRDSWWFIDPHHLPQSAYYRPLQDVWFWLNYHLFGFAVPGWHLTLIAVHLIAVWLVFEVARELSPHRWKPLIAATLFGVMPVHAQAVVWLIAIPLPMSAAFELAAFLCFVRGGDQGGMRRVWALAFFVLALLSHESAVVFPLLLVAYSVIMKPERDHASATASIRHTLRRAATESWRFFAILAGYLGLRLWVLGFISERHFANPMTLAQSGLTLPSVVATYLQLLAAPWSAGPEHPLAIVSSALSRDFYLPIMLMGAAALAAVLMLWRTPQRSLYLFCIAWIAIGLLPVLNLREFSPWIMVQDRYLYFSSAAWCLMAADIMIALLEGLQFGTIVILSAAAIVTSLYAGFLLHLETFWHDDTALFSTCVQRFPRSWFCHFELGSALNDRHDPEGAEREYRTTLAIKPDYPGALLDLAMLLERSGRTPEALDDMRQAVVLMPQWNYGLNFYGNLANNADILGAADLRDSALEAVARLPGGPLEVEKTRAQIDIRHRDFTDAETLLEAASAQDPGDAELWALLATAVAREGKNAQAIDACQRALALKPDPALAQVLQRLLQQLLAA